MLGFAAVDIAPMITPTTDTTTPVNCSEMWVLMGESLVTLRRRTAPIGRKAIQATEERVPWIVAKRLSVLGVKFMSDRPLIRRD